jgi:hypothetical protein
VDGLARLREHGDGAARFLRYVHGEKRGDAVKTKNDVITIAHTEIKITKNNQKQPKITKK